MEKIKNYRELKAVEIAIGMLFALVILPSNAKSIAIMIFGLCTLVLAFRRKWHFDRNFFITNALFYLIIAATYFYSENTEYAIKKLTSMASLLVFPFIFAMYTKEEGKHLFKNIVLYLWIYVLAVFLFNALPFLWFYFTNYSFEGMMQHFPTAMNVDMGKFNIHPIYISMHCSAAVLCSFYIFSKLKSKTLIGLLAVIDISLFFFLFVYAKKGPLIALLVVFTLYILFQYRKGFFKLYLLVLAAFIVLTIAIPKTRNNFIELFKIENIDKGEVTSTNIRYTIYTTANKLVGEAPLLGYGVGDYNYELRQQFKKDNYEMLAEEGYNTHNEYLSMLLIGGVVLLLAFIFMFGMNMVYAIRWNNQLFMLLIVFYSIVMLTENILEREDGVIFFSFFLNFFALKSLYVHAEKE